MKATDNLMEAMENFGAAYGQLLAQIEEFERKTGTDVNNLKGFTEQYPFVESLNEVAIQQWADAVCEGLKQPKFIVTDYEYLNTGGHCMVSVHTVWLPEKNQTVYMLTNEEGCTMSSADYVRNDLEVDDYDELMLETVDWGRITGHEKYFELYRRCLNDYTRDDCKYFKTRRSIPYYLLSDELQKTVSEQYLQWINTEYDGCIETDGERTFESEYYQEPTNDDEKLIAAVKAFQQWHNSIAACEEFYNCDYILKIASREIRLPFVADVWDAVDHFLTSVIENY